MLVNDRGIAVAGVGRAVGAPWTKTVSRSGTACLPSEAWRGSNLCRSPVILWIRPVIQKCLFM